MQLRWRSLAKGLATNLPVLARLANSKAAAEVTPRYYYSVWLRHLRCVGSIGATVHPLCVAELGPGDALGLGLAALLSGAERYYALDRLRFANPARNLVVLEELITLFRARAAIPGDEEFPHVHPRLADYAFPSDLLDDASLDRALAPARLDRLRRLVRDGIESDGELGMYYAAPWEDAANIQPQTVDWVFSQAVLEHVDDVERTYASLMHWLRPGGLMSHRIDYSSHGITRDWHGHWSIPSPLWKIVRGHRAYLINRLPHSAHLAAMRQAGFLVLDQQRSEGSPMPRRMLSAECQGHDDVDLKTSGAFIVASKPVAAA